MGFLGVTPLSGYFEERRGYRGGKELLSEKSAVPPLIEYMLVNTIERDARNDGWKAGIAKGLAEGKSLGLAEGEARGRSEGFRQAKLETAKNLLNFGLSIENIAQATGLTMQDVERLNP